MKIVFLEEASNNAKEYESNSKDLELFFKMAEKLTETDLNKLEIVCNQADINTAEKA